MANLVGHLIRKKKHAGGFYGQNKSNKGMEILSDTVFKGNVDIGSTGSSNLLRITNPTGTVVSIGGSHCNLLNVTGTGWANFNSVSASDIWLTGSGSKLCFDDHHRVSVSPEKDLLFTSGPTTYALKYYKYASESTQIIATRQDLENLNFPRKYIVRFSSIPANCTSFYASDGVPFTANSPISFQLYKVDWPDNGGGCQFTPIFADMTLVTNHDSSLMCVLVNKASGYEMNGCYEISVLI